MDGPVNVHVLSFDLADPELTIDMGFALGRRNYGTSRERTSVIATRYNTASNHVIAAINAAFFGTALEIRGGTLGAGGNLVTRPDYTSAHDVWALLDNDQSWVARRPFYASTTHMTVDFQDGASLALNWLNYTAAAGQYAVYTRDWNSATGITANGVEVVVSNVNFPLRPEKTMVGTITQIRTGAQTQNTAIPAGGFILRATDAADTFLTSHAAVGQPISLEISIGNRPDLNDVTVLEHARGILVDDGVASTESWIYADSFDRHPRTVIACRGSEHFFVVFDGRETGVSIGVAVDHMADFLVNTLHVDRAANLDGGGSSTLWINGTIYNRPSDGSERSVVNALMLVRRSAQTALPQTDTFPASGRQLAWRDKFSPNAVVPFSPASPGGDGYALEVFGTDEDFETVSLGRATDSDYRFEADVHCDVRTDVAADGFERVGLFVRDDGAGRFDDTAFSGGNCYALVFETDTGRVRPVRFEDGVMTDLAPGSPEAIGADGWHRFAIQAEGDHLAFFLDGRGIGGATDAAHTHGSAGIGWHEHFANDLNAQGALVDNVRFAEPELSAVDCFALYR